MSGTISTLSLEPIVTPARRPASLPGPSAGLREYVLGPENALVRQGIGLEDSGEGPVELCFPAVPVLFHAPSGFGKTQLLQALAATWSRRHAPDRVVFMTGDDLAQALTRAQRLDDLPVLQQRLRRADLLLIDDLNALQRKLYAQQLLADTLDHRQTLQRPVVLTASEPLPQLALSARLASRIASGLTIPLSFPSPETRQRILATLCQQREIELSPEAEQLLMAHPALTIPEMVGILNELMRRMSEQPVNLAEPKPANARFVDVSDLPNQLAESRPSAVDPRSIIRQAAQFYGLKPKNLTSDSRRKLEVLARSQAMSLVRELTDLSYQQIGQLFGKRDHTTVLHACRKMETQRKDDASLRQAFQEIRRRVEVAAGNEILEPRRHSKASEST